MSVFENGEREIAFFRQMPQNVNVRNFNFISTTMPRLPYRISQCAAPTMGARLVFLKLCGNWGLCAKLPPENGQNAFCRRILEKMKYAVLAQIAIPIRSRGVSWFC